METNRICRLCLASSNDTIEIFGESGLVLQISAILSQHFWFQVNENDEFPKTICTECWCRTFEFHTFYKNIEDLQKQYYERLKDPSDHSSNQRKHKQTVLKLNEDYLCEIEKSLCSIPEENSIEVEQCKFEETQFDLFENNFEICDVLDNNSVHNSSDDNLEPQPLKPKRIKNEIQKAENKEETSTDEVKELKITNEDKTKSRKQRKVKVNRKENIAKEDEQIRQYFNMECELCSDKFQNFLDAKRHYRSQHQMGGYISCCKRTFFRRSRVLDHLWLHINPTVFKCEICEKIFNDKNTLEKHIANHESTDLKPYQCDICSSTFIKQFKLAQHMRARHNSMGDKHFSCPECGKKYISKAALNTHVRGVHQFANAQVCDICARVFKSKHVFEMHRLEHMDINRPRMQCNICGSWLKNEQSLRRHLHRHNETSQECTVCKKLMANKHSLDTHMRNVHCERTFQCTMCDKAFKNSIALKEHIASHTGESIYTCTYCPQTFKSSANRHSHRKKLHYAEWAKDRGRRNFTKKI